MYPEFDPMCQEWDGGDEDVDPCSVGDHDMQPFEHEGEEGIGCTECGITPAELKGN
jgi:hypothetical protein